MDTDIVIAGGGLNGTTLALAMAVAGGHPSGHLQLLRTWIADQQAAKAAGCGTLFAVDLDETRLERAAHLGA